MSMFGYHVHWFVGTIVGSLALVTLNTLQRRHGLTDWSVYPILFPLLLIVWFAYWYAYRTTNHFLMTWFMGTATVSLLAYLSHIVILGEPVTTKHVMGTLLILIGAAILGS